MIYLDSAATSYYRPDCVAEAVAEAIRGLGNCSRGSHPAALAGARVVYETRERLARLFGAKAPEQIAFTANSTESLNIAIQGLIRPGDRVVTTVLEHNSVLRPLYEQERRGASLRIVGCLPEDNGIADRGQRGMRGRLDEARLLEELRPGTRAAVITHASNLTGNVTNIRRIGRRCRENGILLIVDASQTAGLFPINMEEDGIDVLCFTGHKGLMGPQGTGGLCVRRGLTIAPLLTGGSGIQTYSRTHPSVMPTALEAGTLNGHGIAGLLAALGYIEEQGPDRLRRREQRLADRFREQVRMIPQVRLYGDFEQTERAAIVSLNLGEEASGFVSDCLAQEYEIYTRSGGHCAPLMHEALGTREQGAVRFSFSHFNREDEADQAAEAVKKLAASLCE